MMIRLLAAAALTYPALLFAAAPSASSPDSSSFGGALQCGVSATSSVLKAKVGRKADDADWVQQTLAHIGYPAALPAQAGARDAALQGAALLRTGHIVAAKMLNDEAARSLTSFGKSAFSTNFEVLLTVLTQPVDHASYPSEVRAEGEQRKTPTPAQAQHSHGVDLEESSAALHEIIRRVSVSQHAMGSTYDRPAVRYYLLANGFHDEVALSAAGAGVCALKLDEANMNKLNVSARFMAMPSELSPKGSVQQ